MKVLTIFKNQIIRKPAECQREDLLCLWRNHKFLSFGRGRKDLKITQKLTYSDIFKSKTSIG